jgi:hypothetical protein
MAGAINTTLCLGRFHEGRARGGSISLVGMAHHAIAILDRICEKIPSRRRGRRVNVGQGTARATSALPVAVRI